MSKIPIYDSEGNPLNRAARKQNSYNQFAASQKQIHGIRDLEPEEKAQTKFLNAIKVSFYPSCWSKNTRSSDDSQNQLNRLRRGGFNGGLTHSDKSVRVS